MIFRAALKKTLSVRLSSKSDDNPRWTQLRDELICFSNNAYRYVDELTCVDEYTYCSSNVNRYCDKSNMIVDSVDDADDKVIDMIRCVDWAQAFERCRPQLN